MAAARRDGLPGSVARGLDEGERLRNPADVQRLVAQVASSGIASRAAATSVALAPGWTTI
jgi:hypothetical protein